MLEFKKIELCDVENVKAFTHNNEILACEKSIVNLIVWQKAYKNMFAINDDFLFLKSGKDKTQSFSMPIGDNFKKGLEYIFALNHRL